MKKNVTITFIIFILSIFVLNAQSWQWAKNGGGTASTGAGPGDNTILDMKHDKGGNTYVLALVSRFTAYFMGDTFSINGQNDLLLYKIDCNGNKIWKKQIGDLGSDDGTYSPTIQLDNRENVYVCGFSTASSTHGFRVDTDTSFTPAIGQYFRSYIVKYDKNGNYKLFKTNETYRATNNIIYIKSCLGEDNYLYLLGIVGGNLLGISDTTNPKFYVLKYDTSAVLQSIHPITDSGAVTVWSMERDEKENIYLAGYTTSVGGPDSKIILLGAHQVPPAKSFLCKFDTSGVFKWYKMNDDSAQASFIDIGYYKSTIAITGTGGYYASRPMSYDGLNLSNSYSGGTNSTFVLRVDTNGHIINGSMIGVDGRSIGYSLDIDNVGNICVGGLINCNAAQIGSKTYTASNYIDGFFFKISPEMNYISSDIIFGNGENQVDKIDFDEKGNIYTGGYFETDMQIVTFDTLGKIGGGHSDLFIAKYGVSACNCAYAVANFSDAFTSSLNYTYTSAASNADSIWWDFGDGNTQSGGTTANHTYSTSGNYTVCQHVSNDCSIDEFCKNVAVVTGIDDVKENYSVIIYPNPASSSVYIHVQGDELPRNSVYLIFDVNAKKILSGRMNDNDTAIMLPSSMSDGVYLLEVNDGEGRKLFSKRVVMIK